MSFSAGFTKTAKEKERSKKQRAIDAIPVAIGAGGGVYGLNHYAHKKIQESHALDHALGAVRSVQTGGMGSPTYRVHKNNARYHMTKAIAHGKRAKIGGGIYVAGMLGATVLAHHRNKKQREEAKKLALKKHSEMKKVALSKETIQRAASAAQKKVDLMPPGMKSYAHMKPVEQLGRFTKALLGVKK